MQYTDLHHGMTQNMQAHAEALPVDLPTIRAMMPDFVDAQGQPKILPASELTRLDNDALRALMQFAGVYVWPTEELIAFLDAEWGVDDHTIEIGAGHGVIARALGITATDSFMQSHRFRPRSKKEALIQQQALRSIHEMRVPAPPYGSHVQQFEAKDAIRHWKPQRVLGCYITHKYRQGDTDGNLLGVDETWLWRQQKIRSYCMVGNLRVHCHKPLLNTPHTQIQLDGLVVRAAQPQLNRVFIWNKD